jgi:hypothetical protein
MTVVWTMLQDLSLHFFLILLVGSIYIKVVIKTGPTLM